MANIQSLRPYSSLNNTVRIYEKLLRADKKELFKYQRDGVYPYDRRSTLLHEFIHWQDAQEYRSLYGDISSAEDSERYLKWAIEKGRLAIDKLVQKGYNILDISPYATRELQKDTPRYDEAYTEYRTRQHLAG
nr:MAG TPA_asm: metallopeptidase toxin 3 [Caudoviricetes sp.]